MTDEQAGRDGSDRDLDPTRMINQPALRTSNGLVWIIMGGLFAAVSSVPFWMLILAPQRRSGGLALVTVLILYALYLALLITRVVVRLRVLRLRIMAGCMLAMAAVALIGIWVCMMIERSSG